MSAANYAEIRLDFVTPWPLFFSIIVTGVNVSDKRKRGCNSFRLWLTITRSCAGMGVSRSFFPRNRSEGRGKWPLMSRMCWRQERSRQKSENLAVHDTTHLGFLSQYPWFVMWIIDYLLRSNTYSITWWILFLSFSIILSKRFINFYRLYEQNIRFIYLLFILSRLVTRSKREIEVTIRKRRAQTALSLQPILSARIKHG